MKKVNLLIISLILLSAIGLTMFFLSQMRLKQKDSLLEEKMAEFSEQQEILMQAQKDMQKDKEEKERLARQAQEAQQMAEAQLERERLEREKLVAELVARLKREADERLQAEEKQRELAEKMEALEAAQAEAQAALAALDEASKSVDSIDAESQAEVAALMQKIEQQNQSMVALLDENKVLKEQSDRLLQNQIATEKSIAEFGRTMDKHTFIEVVVESIEDIVTGVVDLFDNKDSKPKK